MIAPSVMPGPCKDPWLVELDDGNWWQECPSCHAEAACRLLGASNPRYAEMWCGSCRTRRWLNKPRTEDMSTGTAYSPASDAAWEMEVKTSGQGDYELCTAGNYPGTITAVIDAGFHEANDQKTGAPYQRRLLILAFELTRKKKDGTPFVMAERYTWSMSNNSNFYALAVNLTGPKREGEKFDPRKLAGMPVMVQVTNNAVSKNGKDKTYHNIGTVAQFPEGLPVPTPSRTPLCWSVMEGKPKPEVSWIPYIYGESASKIIDDSAEAKAGRFPRSSAPAEPEEEDLDKPPF